MVRGLRPLLVVAALALMCGRGNAQTTLQAGSGGTWTNVANWSTEEIPASGDAVIVDMTSGTSSLMDDNFTISSLDFAPGGSDYVLNVSVGKALSIVNGISFNGTNNVTFKVPITDASVFSMVNGTGTVTLGANNSYSGDTVVKSGTLTDSISDAFSPNSALDVGGTGIVSINNPEAVAGLFDAGGGPGSVVLGSEGILQITESSSYSGVISGSGGSLEIMDGAFFEIDGPDTYSGTTTIDEASQLTIGTGGGLASASVIEGFGTLAINSSNNVTLLNHITGSLGLLQEGTGTTTLSNGTNDFSGEIIITQGTLKDGVSYAFPLGSTILLDSPGTLWVTGHESVDSIGDNISGNGTLLVDEGATLELTGNSASVTSALTGIGNVELDDEATFNLTGSAANTFNGSVNIGGGATFSIGNGGLGAATISGSGDLYFINSTNMTVSAALGSVDDNFEVHQTGTATTTLSPPAFSAYTGDTHVNNGTLADGHAQSFSPNSNVFLSNGATLMATNDETIAGLGDDGGPTGHVAVGTGATLTLNMTDDNSQTFSGDISGAGKLKVDGDDFGQETLSGHNTYTGGTIVANAQLYVDDGTIDHPSANTVVGGSLGNESSLGLGSGSLVLDLNGIIGDQPTDIGTVTLEDVTDQWNNLGTLTVGNAGSGTLTISNGQVTDTDAILGNQAGSFGLVQVLGGSWNTSGTLTVGNSGQGGVDLAFPGIINVGSGSGTLTLGNSTSAVLVIGEDEVHSVGSNPGGVLNAAAVNGTAGDFTSDEIIFQPSALYYFTKDGTSGGAPIEIDGAVHVDIGEGSTVLANANSTYGGGTTVNNNGKLIIGASTSGGLPDSPTSGPVGTAPLTFQDSGALGMSANNLALANTLHLDVDGPVSVGSGSAYNLALTGTIHGGSELDWDSSGTLTLSNGLSDFTGGLFDGNGTLLFTTSTSGGGVEVAPTSGPAGIGAIGLNDNTFLTRPFGATIMLSNPIEVLDEGSPAVANIAGNSTGLFVLSGELSDNGMGELFITGPVDLEGHDAVSHTVVQGTTLTVGPFDGVEDTDLFATAGSTINFTAGSPAIGALTVDSSVVNFNASSGSPQISTLSMTAGTINFGAESSPFIYNMVADSPGSTNAMNLPDSDTVLAFDTSSGSPILYYGTINGFGNVDIGGGEAGNVVQLNGNNTYTGFTTIDTGNVAVAGSNNAFGGIGTLNLTIGSAVVVNPGVILANPIAIPSDNVGLAGYGTIAPTTPQGITVQLGTTITGGTGTLPGTYTSGLPGNAIGTLTFGSSATLTFAQAGILQFSIMNAAGSAGTDFSSVVVNGGLVIDSTTATTPFVIQLVGIDGPGPYDGSNTPLTFNFGIAQSWTLLSAGSITNPGGVFNPADFYVDSSSFFNGGGSGTWSVSQSVNNLDLNFTPVPEPSTWALIAGGLAVVGIAVVQRKRLAAGK
jgi:fibronectin-binding autotransporter adhesin